MLFYIKHSKLFSVNGGPQKCCSSPIGVRDGLDPALVGHYTIIQGVHFRKAEKIIQLSL